MGIAKFFTTTVDITRMVWVDRKSTETAVGSFKGHVQQAQPEFVESIGEAWGKVFLLWSAKGIDIQVGDTVTIDSGDYVGTYSVKNKQLNATGANQHQEFVLIKDVE